MADDWITAPAPVAARDDWSEPVQNAAAIPPPPKPELGTTRNNPIDDIEHAAGVGTTMRASLPPDPQVQIKRYAEAFNQPPSDFGIVGDHIVRRIPDGPDKGKYARVEASVSGATGPIDAAERAMRWVASGAGPAIPATASGLTGAVAAILATPETLGAGALPAAMAGGAAGGSAGEYARQKLDAAMAPEGEEADLDKGEIALQGAFGAAGPLIAKPLAMAGRGAVSLLTNAGEAAAPAEVQAAMAAGRSAAEVAAPAIPGATADAAGSATSFGLSNRVVNALRDHIAGREAELTALRKEAQEMGVDLSLSQLTGAEAVTQSERQLLRQPETVQSVVDMRKVQNAEQIPGAVRQVMDQIAPDAPGGKQVEAFRAGADAVVDDLRGTQKIPGAVQGVIDEVAPNAPAGKQISEFREGADAVVQQALKQRTAEANLNFGNALDKLPYDRTSGVPERYWTPELQEILETTPGRQGVANAVANNNTFPKSTRPDLTVPTYDPQTGQLQAKGDFVPTWRAWDQIRKGVKAIIDEHTDDFGKMDEYGRNVFVNTYQPLVRQLTSVNKPYGTALGLYGDASDSVTAVLDGGAGFINKMTGPDRQNMINRVFSGQNLMPDEISAMRRQFEASGKLSEWRGGVRSYLNDMLANAKASPNEAEYLYKTLFEDRQAAVIKSAMGGGDNKAFTDGFENLGSVLKLANTPLEGGAKLLSQMTGPDRQAIVSRVFSGQNLLPDDITIMRRQFESAGKSAEWKAGVRSYIADALADAVAPLKKAGEPVNVAGSVFKNLFEQRQSDILQAAMGGAENKSFINHWNKLGRVLKAASNQLPEGSPTPTDIAAPGLATRTKLAAKLVLKPTSIGPELLEGLEEMQKPEIAKKMAETLLTPEGDKLLKAIYPTTPGTEKANSILLQMLTQAGIVEAEGAAAPRRRVEIVDVPGLRK